MGVPGPEATRGVGRAAGLRWDLHQRAIRLSCVLGGWQASCGIIPKRPIGSKMNRKVFIVYEPQLIYYILENYLPMHILFIHLEWIFIHFNEILSTQDRDSGQILNKTEVRLTQRVLY